MNVTESAVRKDSASISGGHGAGSVEAVMRGFARHWPRRAQVKKSTFDAEFHLQPGKEDFLQHLLPFHGHPLWKDAAPEMKSKVLSCGWLAYNWKTVDIESKIVGPACNHIIYGEVPGLDNRASRHVASQAMVDEAFHVLMVINACNFTRAERGLEDVSLGTFNLVSKMQDEIARHDEYWKKVLIQVATAIVSEVFISDYLKLLSDSEDIQDVNRLVVSAHRQDELAHSNIFRNFTLGIVDKLDARQKEFFISILPKPVRWFSDKEIPLWSGVLDQLGFDGYEKMLRECQESGESDLARVDFSELIELAEEAGILDSQFGVDSFCREGLLEGAPA